MSDLVVASCGHLVAKWAGQLLRGGGVIVLLPRTLVRRNRVVPDSVFANPHFVSLQGYGVFRLGACSWSILCSHVIGSEPTVNSLNSRSI